MSRPKLIRITTVPISLEKLLEGQLAFMNKYYDVTAISADDIALQKIGKKEGVKVFPVTMTRQITPLKDIAAVYKLYRFFKKENPSIVHTHTPKAGIVGMLASWLARVPNRLHTVAGLPLMEATGLKRNILNTVEKLTYRCATKVYPNSKGLYDFIVEDKFIAPNRLKIIGNGSSNGIDTEHFDPSLFSSSEMSSLKATLNIEENAFVFVFVGRLVTDKGINEMVAAFKKLIFQQKKEETALNPYLLLVGPLETKLDPLHDVTLKEISENNNILSVGYKQDVRPYLAMSDALIFPSYREGFPNVVMQAGAMGLPAIVSDINGCNEIIEHDNNGVIIPAKNEEAIYNAFKKFTQNPSYLVSLSKNARTQIVDNYKRTKIWEAILAEYQSLCF